VLSGIASVKDTLINKSQEKEADKDIEESYLNKTVDETRPPLEILTQTDQERPAQSVDLSRIFEKGACPVVQGMKIIEFKRLSG
jgi:hypothetical protein